MITKIKKIIATAESHPFTSAAGKKGFADAGYVEDEYFISGTANVYERQGEGKAVRFADAPYINRILVRKPQNPASFSGNTVIEILNSTSGFDIDRIWALTATHMMKHGDIYVGITSKPNVLSALQKFDRERYLPLSWKNPLVYDIPDERLGNLEGHSHKETEDGLFWDMLMDLGRLLKSSAAENPIHGYWNDSSFLYLAGWSQSGGYMIRYIRDFAQQEGRNIFDGYFACGSISLCTPNLNQEDLTDILSQDRTLDGLDRPYIDMHTESDNALWGNADARQTKSPYYRAYDIAGSSHDTTTTMEEYFSEDADLKKIGMALEFPGKEPYPNSFPYEYAYHAALELLYRWVREGREPLQTASVEYDTDLENVRGEDGNSIGGWRLPMITFPVCVFSSHSTPLHPELTLSSALYGHETPYSAEELVRKYRSLENYRKLIAMETDKCIGAGLLLAEDRESYIRRAVWTAEKYGLK